MGNKVNTSSPTECIQDILSGNISFKTCTSEEIATHLNIVIFLCTNIANGEIEITMKQYPDLIQVYHIIIQMMNEILLSDHININIDSYASQCLQRSLHAITRLLMIPNISKKVFEQSFISILNHLDLNNLNIFSLSFLAFFTGFISLEDNNTSSSSSSVIPLASAVHGSSSRSYRGGGGGGGSKLLSLRLTAVGVEENLRQLICLQLEKYDIYSLLFSFLLNTSASRSLLHSEFPYQILTAILIFRFLSWILTRTSSSTSQLRTKLRSLLLQHQETLFEFLKHEDRTLSDAAVSIMNIIFRQEERGTCIALQVLVETNRNPPYLS
jgi:hypothetical protein